MEEPLESEIVYQNLRWSKSWWGLTPLHLALMIAPAIIYVFLAAWFDDELPKSFGFSVLITSVVVVFGLNFRRPAGWLERWLDNVGTPRLLSNHLQARQAPFPVSRKELQCSTR